jgi:hypothetical protein
MSIVKYTVIDICIDEEIGPNSLVELPIVTNPADELKLENSEYLVSILT